MDFLDNKINKMLISGHFPDQVLYPYENYSPTPYNLKQLAGNGLQVLNQYPELLYSLFMVYEKRVKEIESMNHPELFEHEVNVLINTGYRMDDLNAVGKTYLEAYKLCPAVTPIDKILWYGIWTYYFRNQIVSNNEHYVEYRDIMFSFIYLLKVVQEKELHYNQAINMNAINVKTNILKLMDADWDRIDKKYFSKLTDYGIR